MKGKKQATKYVFPLVKVCHGLVKNERKTQTKQEHDSNQS